jgi:hypothetical protein
MKLTRSCINTENIGRWREFYKDVLQIEPQIYGVSYIEFPTEYGILSMYSLTAYKVLPPDFAQPATNRCLELEFQVANGDGECKHLQKMEIKFVKPPTTQSLGNRSIYIRGPDSDLINFYSCVNNP